MIIMIYHIFPQNGYGDVINILPLVYYLTDSGHVCKIYVRQFMVENLNKLINTNSKIIQFIQSDIVDHSKTLFMSVRIKHFVEKIKTSNNLRQSSKLNCFLFFGAMSQSIRHLFNISILPFCYYDQFSFQMNVNLPSRSYDLFWKPHRFNLTNQLEPPETPYFFIHTSSSVGHLFKYDYTKTSALVIDPCCNIYPTTHPNYQLAQSFVNHHIHRYIDLMIHATELHLSDSVFLCMAIHLPLLIGEDKCYYYPRGGNNYDYIWGPDYGFPTGSYHRKFIRAPAHHQSPS